MRHVWIVSPCAMEKGIGHPLWCVLAAEAAQLSLGQCPPAACPCKGSSSSSSSRDCETLLIVLLGCLGSSLGPSPPAATAETDKGKGGKGKKGTSWARECGVAGVTAAAP